jgi:murein DD-endopeptidase MepM/ murein hydrolase activator NlpD
MQQEKKNNFLKRIFKIYRVVIYNDHLEEKVSLTLSPMNLILFFSILVSITFIFAFLFIAYTPVRDIIPGLTGSNGADFTEVYQLERRADSLESIIILKEKEMNRLKMILNGNFSDSASSFSGQFDKTFQKPVYNNSQETNFRFQFAGYQSGNLQPNSINKQNNSLSSLLIPPLDGYISEKFDAASGHYAVDIVSRKNAPVKATQDGSVIFAEWSATTGNVIILQHARNLVSVYKHNSVLLKKVGNFVRAGEVIALVGNSGELTSGPHLHFELWSKGSPLNPEDIVPF